MLASLGVDADPSLFTQDVVQRLLIKLALLFELVQHLAALRVAKLQFNAVVSGVTVESILIVVFKLVE